MNLMRWLGFKNLIIVISFMLVEEFQIVGFFFFFFFLAFKN